MKFSHVLGNVLGKSQNNNANTPTKSPTNNKQNDSAAPQATLGGLFANGIPKLKATGLPIGRFFLSSFRSNIVINFFFRQYVIIHVHAFFDYIVLLLSLQVKRTSSIEMKMMQLNQILPQLAITIAIVIIVIRYSFGEIFWLFQISFKLLIDILF